MPGKRYLVCSACGQRAAAPVGVPTAAPVCRNWWCSMPGRPLAAVYCVGNYNGGLRKAIVSYKYGADLRWARPFGTLLHGFLSRHSSWFEEYGVICPVPSYLGPGARRAWGHVELICAELGSLAGAEWPVQELVGKTADTEPMSAKSHPVRRRIARSDLSGAFAAIQTSVVEGRRVLVVDDVCASGETLLAVAGALRNAGALEVAGLVLARACWRPAPRALARPVFS